MNKRILIAILILALVVTAIPVFLAARPENPLFTFVQISDLHTGCDKNHLPEAPITKLVMQKIIEQRNFALPDFVIISGDLVHHYDLQEDGSLYEQDVNAQFERTKQLLNELPMPWYPIMGNHDVWGRDYTRWDKYFPNRRRYYFEYEDYLFIALDYFRWDNSSPECEERRQWLQGVLDAHPDRQIIIITHVPLIEMKPGLPVGSNVILKAKPGIKDIIEGHDSVIAILYGHLHLNEVIIENGIYHIETAAVCRFPFMYRYFEVYPDRIDITSYQISIPHLSVPKTWEEFGYTKDEDYTRPEVEDFSIPIHRGTK